jgi:outer membrane lipoprotein carrier protein
MPLMIRVCLISLLSLLINYPAVAKVEATVTDNSNAAKLNALLASLDTFQADFTQVITTETGEELDKLSGQFSLKKPGKFNWQVKQPFSQVLIADGKYLWQYDADLEQAMVRDLDESLGGTPAQLLGGSLTQLQNTYKIGYEKKPSAQGEVEIFHLTPLEEGQFESIQLSFIQGALRNLRLVDTLGQVTLVSFSNAKFGIALDNALFILKLEEGVELVDSRKYLANQDG